MNKIYAIIVVAVVLVVGLAGLAKMAPPSASIAADSKCITEATKGITPSDGMPNVTCDDEPASN